MMISKALVSITSYTYNLDKLLKGFSSKVEWLENQLYTHLVNISKDVNELSTLIILLDDMKIEINLDEFEGLL